MSAAVLLDIFQRARDLVARPENDFAWSSWRDAEHALEEIDGIISRLRNGDIPDQFAMSILFAPTGPMQELSLSSGWGNRFLQLASEFDEATEG
ncbi:MAG: hypothetical protein IPL62_04740 [Caulobacteraceae bacterium]|nr:hypothetical protein [Caulobacteraceae bacterium]MBK8542930.1 hypothetical protein [Caulobacteraceae bacterium]